MSRGKLAMLVLDLIIRVGLAILFVVAWLADNYAEAAVAALAMIVFQLHDIWMEVKK